jgi:iron complex outermembrane receptor protein
MKIKPWKTVSSTALLAAAGCASGQSLNTTAPVPLELQIQSKKIEFRQFDEIEITGSAIFSQDEKTALPLEIITREDIRKSGASQLSDVIHGLSYMQNFVELGQMLSTNGGYSNAAIHGMPNGTLVLINGQRHAPYARQTNNRLERSGIDLNNIPLAAIDRIEILTDGASSLYGTDALAGVINIIMQEPRSGVSMQAEHTRPAGGHGAGTAVSLTAGHGKLQRDGYALRFTAEAAQQDALRGSDRPYASSGENTFEVNGTRYLTQGYLLNAARSPATLMTAGGNTLYANSLWSSSLQATGNCPGTDLKALGKDLCLNNPYPQLDLYPSLEKQSAHLRGEVYLNADTRGYVELLIGQNTQRIHGQVFGAGQWPIAPGSPYEKYAQQAGLTTPATLLWSPSELEGPVQEYRHETRRLAAGVRGEWNAWDYQANLYQTESQSRWRYTRYLSNSALQSLPLSGDMLAPLAGSALNRQLEGMISGQPIDQGFNRIQALEIRGSREAFALPGGNAYWGSGVEWRQEQVRYQNDILPPSQASHFAQNRHDFSAYGELRMPLQPQFEVTASARGDRYDQFNTVNGKLAALWKPVHGWLVRASAGTGFHVPTLGQLNGNRIALDDTQVPANFSCLPQLLAATGALCRTGLGAQSMHVYGAGSANLQPEHSQQTTLGVHHDISPTFSASMDYWHVFIHNKISASNATDILNSPINHLDNFTRDAEGYLALYTPLVNVGRSLKEGLDLDLRYRKTLDVGRLSVQAHGSYVMSSWQQNNSNQSIESDLGKGSIETGSVTPRFKGRVMLGLTQTHWSGLLALNYLHGYVSAPVTAYNTVTHALERIDNLRIPAYWTLDALLSHALSPKMDLRLGVRNLLNQQAPRIVATEVPNLASTSTALADLWGRTVQLGLTVRF